MDGPPAIQIVAVLPPQDSRVLGWFAPIEWYVDAGFRPIVDIPPVVHPAGVSFPFFLDKHYVEWLPMTVTEIKCNKK